MLLALMVCAAPCPGQKSNDTGATTELNGHSYADLNQRGSSTHMPEFSDTLAGTEVGWRRAMLRHGMALRFNTADAYSQNALDPQVPPSQQAYVGQRAFGKVMVNPIFTWDLKALHLRNAQLNIGAGLMWTSWNKAGPRAANLNTLYLYKSFAEGRYEIKAGYLGNNQEFVGFTVGGSLGPGAQGVYALLPNEAGLNYLPLSAPTFNLKWNAPRHFYLKGALQRSTDPAGGAATVAHDSFGVRFAINGLGWVSIYEGGINQAASSTTRSMWVRTGLIHNTSKFKNFITGAKESGNFCAYVLADRQIAQFAGHKASNGFYAGGSAEVTPARFNAYSQYYELRTYVQGPFRSRPQDQTSLLATRSIHSQDNLRNLIAQGKTVTPYTTTMTASYTVHAKRGTFFSFGLSYMKGAAITPHVPSALVGTVSASTFF